MSNPRDVITQARRILRTSEAASEALTIQQQETMERRRPRGETLERAGGRTTEGPVAEVIEASPVELAVAEERDLVVRAGLEGMKKVERGRDAEVTPQERFGLEAIILLTGRPAILIQEGAFFPPPKQWAELNTVRASVEAVIARVGRIEVTNNPNFDWLGTGFLAGPDTVITNRHVAQEFARLKPEGGWTFRAPMTASVDFKAEFGSDESLEFEVTDIVGIHDEHDMAVLRVQQTSGLDSLPDPLPVAAAQPGALQGRKVYVVGYPAWDGRRNDPEPMQRIFSEIYNVKRLQPGEVSGETLASFEIFHDCSTLGGNSGSPVVDLETHRVLGLHFGGRFMQNNHAVPLWLLRDDPLVQQAGLNFA
jgi:Trypsin-like peptidase domain